MDWTEILKTLITTILGLIGTVGCGFLIWGIKKLFNWVRAKTTTTEDENVNAMLDYLWDGIEETCIEAVKAVYIKYEGWLGNDFMKDALDYLKNNLTSEDISYIQNYEIGSTDEADLNKYLEEQIYAAVYDLTSEEGVEC